MINTIKLPCGINKDGNLVYIDEVRNGKECECFCPGCKQPLVARNSGKIRKHHFAHLNVVECEHGFQSALHYIAKDLFLEMKVFTFVKNGKPVRYKIDDVILEKKVGDIIPDIIVLCDGKYFIVEIYVTHSVDDDKKDKIREYKISAIEIDLSQIPHESLDKEFLRQEICKTENYSWVYDADNELIEQKRQIIQKYGKIIPIHPITKAVVCPFLGSHPNPSARTVTLDFCLHCPNCVDNCKECSIYCVHDFSEKVALDPRIFVNENKVMFESDFQNYNKNFLQNLQDAMQRQFLINKRVALRQVQNPLPPIYIESSPNHYNKPYNKNRYSRRRYRPKLT